MKIDEEALGDYGAGSDINQADWKFTITPAPVTNLAVDSYVIPRMKGAVPDTTAITDDQYTGTVTWLPTNSPFLGSEVYTATVTLSPTNNYTFTGVSGNSFTHSGATTVTHSGDDGIVTLVFPATEAKIMDSIAATNVPSKVIYVYGDDFVETGMVITATYDDGTTSVVSGYTNDGKNLQAGATTVTVSYTEGSVTKTTTVGITVDNATITESVTTTQSAV